MNPVVLVPVKDHSRAKQRLANYLRPELRAELARAMWHDVAAALRSLHCPVAVVTDSTEVAATARRSGWLVIHDRSGISESVAVDVASEELESRGFDAVLRLPADVPLVRGPDVELLLADPPRPPFARLVPSRSGTGTNAIVRCPPTLFPSRFGPESLVLHAQESRRAGVNPLIVENPRIALDIDDVDDLRRLMAAAQTGVTQRLLLERGIHLRLEGISLV